MLNPGYFYLLVDKSLQSVTWGTSVLLGTRDTCQDGCVLVKGTPSFLCGPLETREAADVVVNLTEPPVQ